MEDNDKSVSSARETIPGTAKYYELNNCFRGYLEADSFGRGCWNIDFGIFTVSVVKEISVRRHCLHSGDRVSKDPEEHLRCR